MFLPFRMCLPYMRRIKTRLIGWIPSNWTTGTVTLKYDGDCDYRNDYDHYYYIVISIHLQKTYLTVMFSVQNLKCILTCVFSRFMIKHLEHLFCTYSPSSDVGTAGGNIGDCIFIKLSEKFSLLVFSCIQLASKLTHHSNVGRTTVRLILNPTQHVVGIAYSTYILRKLLQGFTPL